MKTIRHILPGFGYFPDDPERASVSGIVAVAYHLARASVDHGFETSLVSFSSGDDRRQFETNGIQVHRLMPRRALARQKADLSYAVPVALFSARAPVDVAHVHSNPYLLALLRAKTRILHLNTPDFTQLPAYRKAVLRADGLIFCSSALQAQFAATVGPIERPQFVAHNGVTVEMFQNQQAEGQRFRKRLGISADEFLVLFTGQLSPVKGPQVLIQAMEIAKSRSSRPLRLVIVGSSTLWRKIGHAPSQSDFESNLQKQANPARVTFVGALPQHEIASAYAACDLFACPSIWQEPFGITNLEAMASGKPVVASRVGGIPEIVVHQQTGILVAPGNASELAEAIAMCSENPVLCQAMGEAGAKRAGDFHWRRKASDVLTVYDQLQASKADRSVHQGGDVRE